MLFFTMASFFVVGILDARYKIEVKVEGGLEGCSHFHFHTLVNYIISISIQIILRACIITITFIFFDVKH